MLSSSESSRIIPVVIEHYNTRVIETIPETITGDHAEILIYNVIRSEQSCERAVVHSSSFSTDRRNSHSSGTVFIESRLAFHGSCDARTDPLQLKPLATVVALPSGLVLAHFLV